MTTRSRPRRRRRPTLPLSVSSVPPIRPRPRPHPHPHPPQATWSSSGLRIDSRTPSSRLRQRPWRSRKQLRSRPHGHQRRKLCSRFRWRMENRLLFCARMRRTSRTSSTSLASLRRRRTWSGPPCTARRTRRCRTSPTLQRIRKICRWTRPYSCIAWETSSLSRNQGKVQGSGRATLTSRRRMPKPENCYRISTTALIFTKWTRSG
mmetsp:Transcript_27176/g.76423  ORF Transcript_27176/g.76423 Transcript_27176/m.76423 type:complete len:206 (-) Transcript_27176:2045-2662(-)